MPSIRNILLTLCVGYILYWGIQTLTEDTTWELGGTKPPATGVVPPSPASHEPPVQIKADEFVWDVGPYKLTALASYGITATVGGIERYHHDEIADLVPYDAVLAWGLMSDPTLLQKLHVSQSARWYSWQTSEQPPHPPAEINRSMANTHLIPRDAEVMRAFDQINVYDRVQLRGYLVQAKRDNGWFMRSSLSRDDTGAGACEILWVDSIILLP